MKKRMDKRISRTWSSEARVSAVIGILFSQMAMLTWESWVHIFWVVIALLFIIWSLVCAAFVVKRWALKCVEESTKSSDFFSYMLLNALIAGEIMTYAHFIDKEINSLYPIVFFVLVIIVWLLLWFDLLFSKLRH